jgi:hypothetical protein
MSHNQGIVPILKLQAHTDAELGQVQLESLAARMTEKRRELTERVEHLEPQMVVKDDCSHADAADAASAQTKRNHDECTALHLAGVPRVARYWRILWVSSCKGRST